MSGYLAQLEGLEYTIWTFFFYIQPWEYIYWYFEAPESDNFDVKSVQKWTSLSFVLSQTTLLMSYELHMKRKVTNHRFDLHSIKFGSYIFLSTLKKCYGGFLNQSEVVIPQWNQPKLGQGPSTYDIRFFGPFLTYPSTHIQFFRSVKLILDEWYPVFENLPTYPEIRYHLRTPPCYVFCFQVC